VFSYILIHRQPSGGFEVRYLQPPTIDSHKQRDGAFRFSYPIATRLTSDSITFHYFRKDCSMSLDKVSSTGTLSTL